MHILFHPVFDGITQNTAYPYYEAPSPLPAPSGSVLQRTCGMLSIHARRRRRHHHPHRRTTTVCDSIWTLKLLSLGGPVSVSNEIHSALVRLLELSRWLASRRCRTVDRSYGTGPELNSALGGSVSEYWKEGELIPRAIRSEERNACEQSTHGSCQDCDGCFRTWSGAALSRTARLRRGDNLIIQRRARVWFDYRVVCEGALMCWRGTQTRWWWCEKILSKKFQNSGYEKLHPLGKGA